VLGYKDEDITNRWAVEIPISLSWVALVS